MLFHLLDFLVFFRCLLSFLITALSLHLNISSFRMCCLHNGGEEETMSSVHLVYPQGEENQEDGIK